MKKIISFLIITTSLTVNLLAQKSYKISLEKSKFSWTGYASVGSYAPTGSLKCNFGNLTYKGKSITNAFFQFDMKTISHENADMQKHLRGDDFFDVEKYPTASFKLEKTVGGLATGILKIKSVQKRITFPFKINVSQNLVLIEAKINVNRTDFGIKYNSTSFFTDLGDYAIKDNFDFDISIVVNK